MSKHSDSLVLIVYAPPFVGDAGPALACVRGVERALPPLRLEWKVSDKGRLIALSDRDEWLASLAIHGTFPLLCNGDETYPVTIAGLETPADCGPGGKPLADVHAELPLDAAVIRGSADLLEGMGDGARAYWGVATPDRAAVGIAEQVKHAIVHPSDRRTPPKGLPWLKYQRQLPSPEIPDRLGWLNYWSTASATAIGFPDPVRDADLLARARRTASGAWIVKLTDEPLDLEIPAHVETLRRVYQRFPAIGGNWFP